MLTYIEHLSDLNEVRVADHFMNRAQLQHDKIIGTSCHTVRDSPTLDQLRPEYIQYSLQYEFHQSHPITLFNPLINPVHTRRYEVSLVGRRAPLQSTRDIIGLLEGERL